MIRRPRLRASRTLLDQATYATERADRERILRIIMGVLARTAMAASKERHRW